jgi:hypothetical protein
MRGWVAAALALFVSCAHADERQELEALRATTLKLIQLLVSEGLLTQEKANALIREAEAAARPPGEKPAVRVPYVPQTVQQDIKNQLREEVMAQAKAERWADPGRLPEWADRVTLEGDVRLRYQHDRLDENNAPPAFFQAFGQNITNTTEDNDRLRVRARLGLRAKVTDGVEAGFGLATGTSGSTGNPISTNNTLGDYFNRQVASIDLAYVSWSPVDHDWLLMAGGRTRNPFFGSDMMWAPDLNFDGVYTKFRPLVRENVRPSFLIGAFPLKQADPDPTQPTRKNKWLYGAQAGLDYGFPESTLYRFGLAYYDYEHIEGIPNTDPLLPNENDWTAPQFRQKGNTLFPINLAGNPALFGLASKFQIWNFTAEAGFRYDEVRRISFLADFAKNVGYDPNEIAQRTGGLQVNSRTTAQHYRVQFGHTLMEFPGNWFVAGGYKKIGADAVLDAFNDGDFHLGGSNAKGWYLGGGYAVGRNAWFGARYLTSNEIDGPPLAIDVFQLDFNARF